MRTISHREYLDMCASVVAASVANPYGENDAVVDKCIERVNILLSKLGYEVDDPNGPNERDRPNDFGKELIGKAISYYDSFNGSHEEFVVARVVDLDEYLMQVRSKSGRSVDIPKHLVDDLLADGAVTDFYELDGCSLKTTYKLS